VGFSIDTTAIQAWKQRIIEARDSAAEFCARATDEVANTLVEELQHDAPFDGEENNGVIPGEEGHLNESFGMNNADVSENATAEVWTNEPIKFQYVIQGTASPILPVEKQALWWPGAEHPVAWVSGQSANPFHEKSAGTIRDELGTIVAPCIQEWLGEV
jgi:hypothetical protein